MIASEVDLDGLCRFPLVIVDCLHSWASATFSGETEYDRRGSRSTCSRRSRLSIAVRSLYFRNAARWNERRNARRRWSSLIKYSAERIELDHLKERRFVPRRRRIRRSDRGYRCHGSSALGGVLEFVVRLGLARARADALELLGFKR